MNLDSQKELTPVLYSNGVVKVLKFAVPPNRIFCFRMHWHERMELLLITQGRLCVSFGDTEFYADAGEMVIIPPGQPHSGFTKNSGTAYYTLMFDLENFLNNIPAVCEYFKKLSEKRIVFENKTSHTAIINTAEQLVKEYNKNDAAAAVSSAAKVYELMALMYRHCLSKADVHVSNDGSFKKVLEFVNKNYADDISSSSLSRKFGFDSAYFSRKFKAVTGLTPTIYIRILRLEKAQKMLRQGYSVAFCAQACGFTDAVYFTRCFKKHFGMTPTEYISHSDQSKPTFPDI